MYRDVLRGRTSRRLLAALACTDVGDFAGLAALLVLAYEATGSVWGPAAVYAVKAIPALLVTTAGSGWLDVPPRKPAVVTLALLTALAVSVAALWPTATVALVVAGLLGAVRTANDSILSGVIADSVDESLTRPLLGLSDVTNQASQVAGLFAGAAVALSVGPSVALAGHAGFALAAALLLARTRLVGSRGERQPVASPLAGVRTIVADRKLLLTAAGAWLVLMVSAVPETLAAVAVGPALVPFAMASNPLGGTIGSWLAGRSARLERVRTQLWWYLAGAAAMVLGGAATIAGLAGAIVAANVVLGAAAGAMVGAQTVFIRQAPKRRMAQVNATMAGSVLMLEGVGALLVGLLATNFGVGGAYLTMGLLLGAGLLLLLCAARQLPAETDPAARTAA